MRLKAGQTVNALRVLGTLGEGATSQVYLVADEADGGELRALKLLSVVGSTHRQRLRRESDAIRLIRHPNVVSVHRMVEHDGMTGILMEFVSGPTVLRWIQTAEPRVEDCLAVAVGVLRGLQAIHDADLVHRDIKPGNIILSTVENGPILPRLLDFGLVKHLGKDHRLTVTGVSMGTPAYMAPEQLRDASKVDHRADLYSLGCVLFEMIAGARPFVRDEWWDAYRHVEEGSVIEMNKLPPDTPDHVCEVLRTLLQPDPADRYQSADAAVEAILAPYPQGHSVRDGWLEPTDFGGRIARGLAAVQRDALRPQDLAEGVLAEALPSVHLEPLDAPTDPRSLPPSGSRQNWIPIVIGAASLLLLATAGALFLAPLLAGSRTGLATAERSEAPGRVRTTEPAEAADDTNGDAIADATTDATDDATADTTDDATADTTDDTTDDTTEPVITPPPREAPAKDDGVVDVRPSVPAPPPTEPDPWGTTPAPAKRAPPPAEGTPDGPALAQADTEAPSDPGSEPASVAVAGDASGVRLIGPDGASYGLDEPLPAGQYTIQVRWQPGEEYATGGQVRLTEGEEVTITCQRAFFQCRS